MAKAIISALFLIAFSSLANAACPTIVSRAEWGSRTTSTSSLTTIPPTHVVIHHSATSGCTTQATCASLVKSFQNTHIDVNGWADIGYNFLVGGDGKVYEGRGWGKTGAHTVNYNSKSIGICFIGTFTSSGPTSAAISAAQDLISCGVSSGQIASSYKLMGHRQGASTECPGNSLYSTIQGWSNWVSNP